MLRGRGTGSSSSEKVGGCFEHGNARQAMYCTYNVTLRRVGLTTAAVEKQ